MAAAEYMVRLDAFEGPLDLLLFLIRRAEVEIADIPIAQITEQYLRYIEDLADPTHSGRIDIERAGEFLVMAATLMEIKSRMLAPPAHAEQMSAEGAEDPEGAGKRPAKKVLDPREELVKQLLEYKRYRDAGDTLNRFKREWEDMFPAGRALASKPEVEAAPQEEQTGPVDLEDIELIDLVEAFGRIIETVDLTRIGEHHVAMDDTPIELHAEDIVDRLKRRAEETLAAGLADGGVAEMDFVTVFENRTKSEMIGLFLAVLELVKQQRVWVRQQEDDRSGKRIVLRLADAATAEPPVATPDPATAQSETMRP
jgi:segregation and condensation protein A